MFEGPERRWLVDCIDSNFVSSVGARVTAFEERVAAFTGARFAVATVNGTAALHVALQLAGVTADSEVLTQALTFVATCNAVRYAQAWPVFIDVDRDTLSLSPLALAAFLDRHAERRADGVYNRTSGRRLATCVPMHTFGLPGTLSFNGNKIITTGGGGMILTDDPDLAARAKHLTTTAKIPHPYEFVHDETGYNYRLPNLNAALGCEPSAGPASGA